MKTKLLETKFKPLGEAERKRMSQLIHVISRKISSATGRARCPRLGRVVFLVPLLLTSQVVNGQGNPNAGAISSQARVYGLSYGEAPGGRPLPTPRPRPTPFPRPNLEPELES
jgi:hypothetical protein